MLQKLKQINSKKLVILPILIILVITIYRLISIELRPIHHDESLHAHYSQIQLNDYKKNHYKYNPMLHGPLLYNITSLSIAIFGNSKLAIRLPALIFGTLLLIIIFLIALRSSSNLFVFSSLMLIIGFSPTITYWSLFLRNDIIIIFLQILFFYILFYKESFHKSIFLLPLLTLQFCLKENSYITSAMLASILFLTLFVIKFNVLISKLNYKLLLISLIISILIYITLLSSFFYHPDGIIDGIYRKSLSYWFNQHQVSRIGGPFSFQSFILGWYEPAAVVLLITTVSHFFMKSTPRYKTYQACILLFILLIYIISKYTLTEILPISFFSFIIPFDLVISLTLFLFGGFYVFHYLKEREFILFYLSFFSFGSFFIYSFVGEKVPWLSIYPLIYFYLFSFIYWSKQDEKVIKTYLILLLIVINFLMTISLNSFNYNNPNEIIHQVGSTLEFENTIINLKKKISSENSKLLVKGDHIWPSHYFLYNVPNYQYWSGKDISNFKFLLLDNNESNKYESRLGQYDKKVYNFRKWWWPNFKQITLKNYGLYLFSRQAWGQIYATKINLYTKQDI